MAKIEDHALQALVEQSRSSFVRNLPLFSIYLKREHSPSPLFPPSDGKAMSERRSFRRKPLTDRTNTPILSPSPSLKIKRTATPKTKPKSKASLSNSLTSTGSNDSQELRQQQQQRRKYPSVDPPHSSTPEPTHSHASDDDRLDFETIRTCTQLSIDGKKDKGKAADVSIPSSCPPMGRFKGFAYEWDKGEGEHRDAIPSKTCLLPHTNKKKLRHSEPSSISKHSLPQDFIEKQKAYFAEIDAFELPVEIASESELE